MRTTRVGRLGRTSVVSTDRLEPILMPSVVARKRQHAPHCCRESGECSNCDFLTFNEPTRATASDASTSKRRMKGKFQFGELSRMQVDILRSDLVAGLTFSRVALQTSDA